MSATAAPLLRTLAPALRNLAAHLSEWLEGFHPQPFQPIARAVLEGAVADLRRKAEDLDIDRPHLVIMLMGGTGVGKSSLLNALAGEPIAQAAFTRPTTRDPVVYYHRSLRPERLDPALRNCRLVAHDREELEQKVLVDTPDLDSNEPENRAKLEQLLPVADVVLYVGSQEKYHDQIGWRLFREQRKRRAFAFVLNKWDRCVQPEAAGLRPDEDLLRDLLNEGFQNPLLFRTSAQFWIDRAERNGDTSPPPAGEQFADLVQWIELGLSRLEIEAVKARGVSQLLDQCDAAMLGVCPPELTDPAAATTAAWEPMLEAEAEAFADVLLTTLDPSQHEIEHHFRLEGHRRFRNLMGGYLALLMRIQYAGSRLRGRVPFVGKPEERKASIDLAGFTHECIRLAGERSLDQRHKALAHKLLVEADRQEFPAELLPGPMDDAVKLDWRGRFEVALNDALMAVEQHWTKPSGPRAWLQNALVRFANVAPELTLIASILVLLWRFIVRQDITPSLFLILLPFLLTLVVLILLQVILNLALPLRWPAIRSQFRRELLRTLGATLNDGYLPLPQAVAESLAGEREKIAKLQAEADDVKRYLKQQQQATNVEGLYGA